MLSLSSIQSYQEYYHRKFKKKEIAHEKFYEYVRRHMKYRKYFSKDTFGIVCRVTYILGEPFTSWIPISGKIII